MLRIARALGFLAPIAVAIFITVVLSTSPTATGAARDLQLLLAALALAAGMTSMALACWSYIGWRLNRIARALEDTLDTDLPDPAARIAGSRLSDAWRAPSMRPPGPSCRSRPAPPTIA